MFIKFLIISLISLSYLSVKGQRIINKGLYFFPINTKIDTIGKRFPHKFILTLDSSIKISRESIVHSIPKNAKKFFVPTFADIHLIDSLIRNEILKAVVSGDSIFYLKRFKSDSLYRIKIKKELDDGSIFIDTSKFNYWYNQPQFDYKNYKLNHENFYLKEAKRNKIKIKASDKYYFGYINQQNRKRIVVLFDPKKIRTRLVGCIRWLDFCNPLVIDLESKEIFFAYFPKQDPEEN